MANPPTTFTNVKVTGTLEVPGDFAASDIDVEAYATSGVDAGTLQAVIEALADRIQALEDA